VTNVHCADAGYFSRESEFLLWKVPFLIRWISANSKGGDTGLVTVSRRQKEKEQRKIAILKASQQLFFKKGYQSVSVESIARKAQSICCASFLMSILISSLMTGNYSGS